MTNCFDIDIINTDGKVYDINSIHTSENDCITIILKEPDEPYISLTRAKHLVNNRFYADNNFVYDKIHEYDPISFETNKQAKQFCKTFNRDYREKQMLARTCDNLKTELDNGHVAHSIDANLVAESQLELKRLRENNQLLTDWIKREFPKTAEQILGGLND